jgi:hypothetical protein
MSIFMFLSPCSKIAGAYKLQRSESSNDRSDNLVLAKQMVQSKEFSKSSAYSYGDNTQTTFFTYQCNLSHQL